MAISPCAGTRRATPFWSAAARGETVRCDIQTLTAMFYGYKRPTYLKRVERLQANDTAVRILEDIIPIEQPYFSDYF